MNQPESRNAVVLVVDGLNAGMLGPYGNTWFETENFNRLAARSLVFDYPFAPSANLKKTYGALWNVENESKCNLLDLIGGRGISSTLVSDEDFGDSSSSFDRVIPIQTSVPKGLATSIEETELANFFAQILQLLSQVGDESESSNNLYWLHSKGLFGAWDAPYELRQQLSHEEDPDPPHLFSPPQGNFDFESGEPDELLGYQQACAAQVFLLDKFMGFILDLMDSEAWNETLFCLTSSRGYSLGEHGLIGYPSDAELDSAALHNEFLHMPLMVCLPGGSEDQFKQSTAAQAIRNGSLVSTEIVSRIVANWLNEDSTQFSNLWNDLTNSFPITDEEAIVIVNGDARSIQTHAWKMIRRGDETKLYAKPDDRWEVNEVSRRCPHVIEALDGVLESLLQSVDGLGPKPVALRVDLPELLSSRE